MDTVGMENLSSAAAQGEQASEPHHANGYNFTGADPNVRTLEDAVRHLVWVTITYEDVVSRLLGHMSANHGNSNCYSCNSRTRRHGER